MVKSSHANVNKNLFHAEYVLWIAGQQNGEQCLVRKSEERTLAFGSSTFF